MNKPIEIPRTELYRLVWSEPLTRLAKRFNISDVALGKLCKRHNIPRPYQGYWQRKRLGQSPKSIELPTVAEGKPDLIQIQQRVHPDLGVLPTFPIPKRMTNPHRVTREIAACLDRGQLDDNGLLFCAGHRGFPVRVGKSSKPRALRILDTCLKALERRGHKIQLEKNDQRWTLVAITQGQRIAFQVRERLKRCPHKPKSWEKESGYDWGPRYDLEPTSRLVVEIDSYIGEGLRKTWGDTARKQLDDVGGFVASLEATAQLLDERDREFEERRRREQQLELRRQQEAEREQARRQRVDRLYQLASDWQTGKILEAFMDAVEQTLGDDERSVEFVTWGRRVANDVNPLRTLSPVGELINDLGLDGGAY